MKSLLLVAAIFAASTALADTDGERAASGDAVVLNRLYPKAQTVELETSVGYLLNPTYVESIFAEASLRYHMSEKWGLGVRYGIARNHDRGERACVESFYNDPDHEAGAPCASEDGGAAASGDQPGVNVGPAYPRIREPAWIASVFADYTLAYGKQILLQSITSYFDIRLRGGLAVVTAHISPERYTVIGDPARPSRGDPETAGVEADDSSKYGPAARPDPVTQTSVAGYGAIVQEMHFLRRFFVAGELGAYVGMESFLLAHLGLGMRF